MAFMQTMEGLRMPKCRVCKEVFEKTHSTLQAVCSPKCGIAYSRQTKATEWRREKRRRREKLKTLSDYTKDAQKAINAYVRLRDANQGCISCGTPLAGRKFDAGHYRSTGAAPHLRFNEFQIYGQCVPCNQHLSGNLIEYRLGLIGRMGREIVRGIEEDNEIRKYTKEELLEIRDFYRAEVKRMMKGEE